METVILGAKRRGFRWGFVVGDFFGDMNSRFFFGGSRFKFFGKVGGGVCILYIIFI